MISSPGDSSVPANREPSITAPAPLAIAFTISPESLIPPSAMIATLCFLATSYTLYIADSCGTPTPATTLVVQIEPGPTPTFSTFAPAFIKSSAASAVTIFPPTISKSGKFCLISFILSKTPLECPCAESTAMISTPASTNAETRSMVSTPIPTPAPTINLPDLSLFAFGYSS